MKFLVSTLIILFFVTSSFAEEKKIEYKNWKTFQSDYGYEFKYPDCWKVSIDSPDEKGSLSQIKSLFIAEDSGCITKAMDKEIPNGISLSAAWKKINSNEEFQKIVAEKKQRVKNFSKTEYDLIMKDFSTDTSYSVTRVHWPSGLKSYIRWEMEFYCPTFKIQSMGPSISNPDQSFLDEFKKGNLALPEPYKTTYESIKCIEPKAVEMKSAAKMMKNTSKGKDK